MGYLRRHVRWSGAVLTLVVLIALAILVGTTSRARTAQAAPTAHPACRASQIVVSAGATLFNANYPVRTTTGVHQESAYEAVPVYFYNRGDTCHLLMGAPAIGVVRDTTTVTSLKTLKLRDLSVGVSAENTRRPVVARHQKIEALFVIVRPVGPAFKSCDPVTGSGLLVQGYARPIGTFHFIVRRLRTVCFDSGVGRIVLDYGVAWPTA